MLTKTDSRKIHHLLPSSGGWETKMPDYLSNVNPAGTVPVLVHNGHPVYESHEQILYIDRSGVRGINTASFLLSRMYKLQGAHAGGQKVDPSRSCEEGACGEVC